MFAYIKNIRKALVIVIISAIPTLAFATMHKEPVISKGGKNWVNSFDNCVLTKWDKTDRNCKGMVTKAKKPTTKSRSYLVFFDFDSANISAQAESIINKAFNDSKDKQIVSVELTGHTDLSGSTTYNDHLSRQRAISVKNELNKLGLSKGRMGIIAKGESTPLVPTADGVREPQNRRVEIVFYY